MQNLKIRVNNEAESKEAQELFFELGLRFVDVDDFEYPQWLAVTQPGGTFSNYSIGKNLWYACNPKEITFPKLRDLVVLKRNDVDDATHTGQDDWKWYISSNGDGYVWQCGNPQQLKQWDKASLDVVDLKPIEKTMKEYLVPDNGGYRVAVQDAGLPIAEDCIAIPEGAEKATFCRGFFAFWKDGATQFAGEDSEWDFDYDLDCSGYLRALKDCGAKIIWQRATHPEELPFIDDEPRGLNDQYTEIEQVRQDSKDNVNHPSHYTQGKVECIDALESATIGKSGIEAVCVANVIKYLWRYEDKGGLESILKAKWYLDKLIECKK